MNRFIPDKLRTLVGERAKNQCEYCRIHQDFLVFSCQIDHIISLKHGGETTADNLAFSCLTCNQNKGSDVGTFLKSNQKIVRFYNPRRDKWKLHFYFNEGFILPKTTVGEATVKIFQFNTPDRVMRRNLLILSGNYHL